jgi:hypothetical protein
MTAVDGPQPAGWYPNPDGPGNRFWSGSAWTDSVQDAEGSGPPPDRQTEQPTQSQGYSPILPPSKGTAKWWRRWW